MRDVRNTRQPGVHAQSRYRPQQVVRLGIGTHFARRGRCFEQRSKCGQESLFEVGGQRVESQVPRVQGSRKAAFGHDEGGISLHPARRRVARSMLCGLDLCGVCTGVNLVMEDGCDKARVAKDSIATGDTGS